MEFQKDLEIGSKFKIRNSKIWFREVADDGNGRSSSSSIRKRPRHPGFRRKSLKVSAVGCIKGVRQSNFLFFKQPAPPTFIHHIPPLPSSTSTDLDHHLAATTSRKRAGSRSPGSKEEQRLCLQRKLRFWFEKRRSSEIGTLCRFQLYSYNSAPEFYLN